MVYKQLLLFLHKKAAAFVNDLHDRSYSHITVSNISEFPGPCNYERVTKFSLVYIVQICHMDYML